MPQGVALRQLGRRVLYYKAGNWGELDQYMKKTDGV
jgi:hypothetical protein